LTAVTIPAADGALLAVRNLNSGYGTKLVVRDVSLDVRPGEIVALFGHNGAGKTTLLKTLVGVIQARGGTVEFAGRALARVPVATRVAAGLRLLPEGRGIFADLTVAENFDVIAACNAKERAPLFRVEDILEFFPALLERRRVRAGSLSGGQQQMLALGLCMIGTPRCLLLDEPSIGLAPNLVERLFEQTRAICKERGVASVLVEQNVAAAMKIADRVVIMNSGRIVFSGLPAEASTSNFWSYF
jgi:branched-chain amino acid transport system ATP-binding protein